LVFISILAGLGEEMFFRGWLQPYLVQYIDTVPALLLASLLFGLFHPISLVYVLFATLFGLYLGLLLLVTDNLLPPIIAHAFYDFVALVYLAQSPPPHPGPLASSYSPPDDTLP
jgi:membrane protease YdiL (CAAX protease family)